MALPAFDVYMRRIKNLLLEVPLEQPRVALAVAGFVLAHFTNRKTE